TSPLAGGSRSRASRSERQEPLEERPVALQREPQRLRRRLGSLSPFVLELAARRLEALGHRSEQLLDEKVRLAHRLARLVDERALDLDPVPPQLVAPLRGQLALPRQLRRGGHRYRLCRLVGRLAWIAHRDTSWSSRRSSVDGRPSSRAVSSER